MPVEKQLDRWIKASVEKHFYTLKENVYMHFEGKERDTDSLSEWFELRLDGPMYKQLSPRRYRIRIVINLLVVMTSNRQHHKLDDLEGKAQSMFTNCIGVYRYGDIEDDSENDDSFIEFLRPVREAQLDTTPFGETRPASRFQQTSLELAYEMMHTKR